MVDISQGIRKTVAAENCSPLIAFFTLIEGDNSGIQVFQPESRPKSCRRLRNKSSFSGDWSGLGNNIL